MPTLKWITVACAGCILILSAARMAVPAQTFTVLVNLDADNAGPTSPLVQAAGGELYGTGTLGGHGSVFTITPAGVLTTLRLLQGSDGSNPQSGLIQGTDGSFYGTAVFGGANGFGSIYKITPSRMVTVLYSFCPQKPCADGEQPIGGLVQAADGNFYGTAALGGRSGDGTIFQITPGGALTTIYRFNNTDGSRPFGALVQGSDGELYGTTLAGGTNEDGTVFRITTSGVLRTLHLFNGSDGAGPHAPLLQTVDGNFYGTTSLGGKAGCGSGCGTIFKITRGGTFTTLYKFSGTDGAIPEAPLTHATDDNFYGTTVGGGAPNSGTAFKITSGGLLTTIHTFCSQNGCPDGRIPYGLLQYTNGKIYGTTVQGGANNDGTVYSLSLGLRPFVKTLPIAGQVGTAVTILGTNLTGTSAVTFNGTPAIFIVKSRSAIKATVPSGATTGAVQVATPDRTLSSNVSFQVLP